MTETASLEPVQHRKSNFELLRIISMLFIVMFHASCHGTFDLSASSAVNRTFLDFMLCFGKLGVDVFVMISGYFLITSSGFKKHKAMKLWLQMLFYSVIISFFVYLLGDTGYLPQHKMSVFLPVLFGPWWFASVYFIMYALHPFLNKVILCLSREAHFSLILFLMVLWCVIPTLLNYPMAPEFPHMEYSNLAWFLTLYIIAAYFRRFPERQNKNPLHYAICFTVLILLYLIWCMYLGTMPADSNEYCVLRFYFHNQNSVPIVLAAVFLFLTFKNMDMKHSAAVNLVASSTFGIYLIHDWNGHMLWTDIIDIGQNVSEPFFIITYLGCVLMVFTLSMIIELTRRYVLERPLNRIIDRFTDKVSAIIGRTVKWLCDRM